MEKQPLRKTSQQTQPEPPSETTWQRFSVPYEYPVSFTDHLFNPVNALLRDTLCRLEPNKQHRIMIFIDQGLLKSMPDLVNQVTAYAYAHETNIKLVCPPALMPAGEQLKSNAELLENMQNLVAEHKIDRHSYIVGIGGGALLDAIGLVAATAHRGIRHIRIPTTVLAQNDSGVGVKNGVNQYGQKNYLGSFAPPFAVLNDYHFIRSLPPREKIAGMAEAVKVALIRDAEFYNWLCANTEALVSFSESAMQYMIRQCAELHMRQIASGGDPFETGNARPLDFGHWSAHKLETLTHFELRHGEAVAIGLALDTHYSVLTGLLATGTDEHVCSLLESLGFALWHPSIEIKNQDGEYAVIAGLSDFQEHLGGELCITLLDDIGSGIEVHEIDHDKVLASVQWLKNRHAN